MRILCRNAIPFGRGLGSSAAAVLSGVLAANALANLGWDEQQVIGQAARIEGHPDNVGAAMLGGMVICADRGPVVQVTVPDELRAVVFVPDQEMATPAAREVVPGSFSREDAVHNAARCALLVTAMLTGRLQLLAEAMQDRWHQPARSRLMPHVPALIRSALAAGAHGACLAGAGPSVLALCTGDDRGGRLGDGGDGGADPSRRPCGRLPGPQLRCPGGSGPVTARSASVPPPSDRCIVQKFGGSSVASAELIQRVARRIAATRAQHSQVVAVVSAMGDSTDELISLAHKVNPAPPSREMDQLLSTGEIITAPLMAMALERLGVPAISLTGSQAGIRTSSVHRSARIVDIVPQRIIDELKRGRVVVVAGFQGVDEALDITTLGRGGTDTTAVALAVELSAERCEIYTDVAGVYTADPRVEPRARPIPEIAYPEMLEFAAVGAKVMHPARRRDRRDLRDADRGALDLRGPARHPHLHSIPPWKIARRFAASPTTAVSPRSS